MTAFATINGVNIVAGSLAIPRVGMWTADVAIATDEAMSGAATVVLGNLTLTGTIYRSNPFAGQTRARIVGGAAGWRTQLGAKAYTNASGVSLRMILNDAAKECGEHVTLATDTQVGPFYARLAGIASTTLRAFCPQWYVDTSGVTQIGDWPTVVVASPFVVTDQRPDEGLVEIATEDYASWLPGASFSGPTLDGTFQSFGSVYTFKQDGTFRLQILTDTADDRLLGPLQKHHRPSHVGRAVLRAVSVHDQQPEHDDRRRDSGGLHARSSVDQGRTARLGLDQHLRPAGWRQVPRPVRRRQSNAPGRRVDRWLAHHRATARRT